MKKTQPQQESPTQQTLPQQHQDYQTQGYYQYPTYGDFQGRGFQSYYYYPDPTQVLQNNGKQQHYVQQQPQYSLEKLNENSELYYNPEQVHDVRQEYSQTYHEDEKFGWSHRGIFPGPYVTHQHQVHGPGPVGSSSKNQQQNVMGQMGGWGQNVMSMVGRKSPQHSYMSFQTPPQPNEQMNAPSSEDEKVMSPTGRSNPSEQSPVGVLPSQPQMTMPLQMQQMDMQHMPMQMEDYGKKHTHHYRRGRGGYRGRGRGRRRYDRGGYRNYGYRRGRGGRYYNNRRRGRHMEDDGDIKRKQHQQHHYQQYQQSGGRGRYRRNYGGSGRSNQGYSKRNQQLQDMDFSAESSERIIQLLETQVGSRTFQKKLETASTQEKSVIFKKIQDQALQLMKNEYANYAIQKFFDVGSDEQVDKLVSCFEGHYYDLSVNKYGGRVIQKSLEIIDANKRLHIAKSLKDKALDCAQDINGSHVIQKCFQTIKPEKLDFFVDAFLGSVKLLSEHVNGSRTVETMLEYCVPPLKDKLFDEIVENLSSLMKNQCGSFVVQKCIETQDNSDKLGDIVMKLKGQICTQAIHVYGHRILETLMERCNDSKQKVVIHEEIAADFIQLSKNRYGSFVIRKCIETMTPEELDKIALDQVEKKIVELSIDFNGSFVVHNLLENCAEDACNTLYLRILQNLHEIGKIHYGSYVIQKVLEYARVNNLIFLVDKLDKGRIKFNRMIHSTNGCKIVDKMLTKLDEQYQNLVLRQIIVNVPLLTESHSGTIVLEKSIRLIKESNADDLLERAWGRLCNLAANAYGSRLVRKFLDFCGTPQRKQFFSEIRQGFVHIIKNRNAFFVVRKLLYYCNEEQLADILKGACSAGLVNIVRIAHGLYVVEKCLEILPEGTYDFFLKEVVAKAPELINNQHGSRLIENIVASEKTSDEFRKQIKGYVQTYKQPRDNQPGSFVVQLGDDGRPDSAMSHHVE